MEDCKVICRLAELRDEVSTNAPHFAELVGFDPIYIWNWEHGKHANDLKKIKKTLKVLKKKFFDVWSLDNPPKKLRKSRKKKRLHRRWSRVEIPNKWDEARLKLRYTQYEVAEILGINTVKINQYESGQHLPRMKTLLKMLYLYGTTFEKIYGK